MTEAESAPRDPLPRRDRTRMYFVLPPAAREFYTASEAAALFGVSVDTIRDWRKRRLLRTVRTPGGRVRIPAADIEALVPLRKRGTREPSARDR